MTQQEERAFDIDEALDLPAEAIEVLKEDVEARDVAAPAGRVPVSPQIEREGGETLVGHRLGEGGVAATVVGKPMDEDERGAGLRNLPRPVV